MYDGRIKRELRDLQEAFKNAGKDELPVKAKLHGDGKDLRHWTGMLYGPLDTCYQGGIFYVDILFPPDYPFKPPKMKFANKIWHPNISS